jgi:hypothetical protein
MKFKMNRYLKYGLILLLICWLFLGIYPGDFDSMGIYVKIRPSFSIELSSEERLLSIKEIDYNLFVVSMLFILIQLTISFICFGTKVKKYKCWQLPLHLIICFLITTICLIIIILSFGESKLITFLFAVITYLINYFFYYLIQRQWRSKKMENDANFEIQP